MDIGSRAITGLRWLSGAKFAGQLFAWVITLVVIRLLTQADYGLMAMAMLFVNFLMLLNELGLGAVLIQREQLDEEEVRRIFGIVLFVNLVFFIILFFSAPLFADFFGEQRLTAIIQVLSFQFLIGAFEVVPVSLLERELDYKKKSLVYLGASVSGGVTTLLLALNGFGVWSLVWGSMTSMILKTIGINVVSPFLHLPLLSLSGLKKTLSFGGLVTIERTMWFFYIQADVLIIGKLLGKEALGLYAVAMHISSLVMHKIGGIINDVVFPAFSRVQGDQEKVASYFLKAVRIMSFIVFPLFFGMAAVADEFVLVVLGDKWTEIAPILSILVLVMPLRMVSNLLPPALQGVGRADTSVYNLGLATIVMPLAFIAGSPWGLMGVSLSWLIAFPLVFYTMLARSVRHLCVTLIEVFQAMMPPAISSLVMLLVIYGVKSAFGAALPVMAALFLYVAIGVLVYGLLSLGPQKNRFHEVLALVRR